MAEPCIHDMDPATCAVCNGAERRAAAVRAKDREPARRGPWIFARWDGKCAGCGERFEAGEKIRADGDSGWLCGECGDG